MQHILKVIKTLDATVHLQTAETNSTRQKEEERENK